MKVKVVTGFREDQYHTIEAEEAHKAYYLFLHPQERGIFSNGVALLGSDIRSIVPDYHATMGWNPTHELDSDDWNEIRGKKIDTKLQFLLENAKMIAQSENPQTNKKLSEAIKELPPRREDIDTSGLAEKMRLK